MITPRHRGREADIILVYPKTGMDLGATIAPPHSLLAVAAPLYRQGYRIKIIDQRTDPDWKRNLEDLLETGPLCVGISTMTGSQIRFALEAARVVRKGTDGRTPIIWGGPHPSILPEQTLADENVDIVCVGEGEITFSEIVSALESKQPLTGILGIAFKDGGRVITTPARPLVDVETLLPVPWELLTVEHYIHPDFYLKKSLRSLDVGQTSRGCPFRCGFCSSASIRQRKWRAKSVEKSLGEILEPVRRFRLDGIWIRDDEFYVNRERTRGICEGIIKSGLKIHWYTSGTRADLFKRYSDPDVELFKRSGAYTLKFGAESGSNRILKLIEKGITREDTIEANLKAKKHGIIPVFALMVGFPTEIFAEINQTIDLAMRLMRDNPRAQTETIAPYTALPGTPLYGLALEMGLKPPQFLAGWANWNFDEYDFEGRKLPWFSSAERRKVGNIAYISVLSNAILNAIGGIKNVLLKNVLRIFFKPVARYYRFRLRRKYYTFYFDLMLVRYLRDKIFYRSHFILK